MQFSDSASRGRERRWQPPTAAGSGAGRHRRAARGAPPAHRGRNRRSASTASPRPRSRSPTPRAWPRSRCNASPPSSASPRWPCTGMSPGKADLIALMVDTASDPPPLLDGEADGWRAQPATGPGDCWRCSSATPWLWGHRRPADHGPQRARLAGASRRPRRAPAWTAANGWTRPSSSSATSAPSPSSHRPAVATPGPPRTSAWDHHRRAAGHPRRPLPRGHRSPGPRPAGPFRWTGPWSSALNAFDGLGVLIAQRSRHRQAQQEAMRTDRQRCAVLVPTAGGRQTRSCRILAGSTMPPDGRDRPAGELVVVLIVRGGRPASSTADRQFFCTRRGWRLSAASGYARCGPAWLRPPTSPS